MCHFALDSANDVGVKLFVSSYYVICASPLLLLL